ncbi:MAG TPA: nucleoside-diphosphate sugar epimerase/dehydratase [Gemmatimonadales bacterium]|nr:nucleoside-diphosphate sugar epimerase/dehydratase [Gemmatimonadales bacterium]
MDHNRVLSADRLVRFAVHLALNLILILISYRLAYELRFDFAIPAAQSELFWLSLPLLVVFRFAAFANSGVFRAHWLHFGPQELLRVGLAVTLSSVTFAAVLYLSHLSPGVPRSVLVIDWAGAILLIGGFPLVGRALRETRVPFTKPGGRRTLIIGTGKRAEEVLREARRVRNPTLWPVGLISLNNTGSGLTIGGVQVAGTLDNLPAIRARLKAELAIVALETDEPSEVGRAVEQCIAAELQFKILPSVGELLEGNTGADRLRHLQPADLLGRTPVVLDLAPVAAELRNSVILLTGAAGSIGSELARQIAAFRPARLVLLDQAESDLYFIHLELCQAHPGLDLVPVICDITNSTGVARVCAQHRPDYVIHAAAYKHVPLMETNAFEAVRSNVLGTLLVATTAVRYGAKKLLLVSTDKAIRPSSVMGATKRIAERIIFGLPNLHRSGTDFRAVRFGNVLASKGSVIPLFQRQLAAGGPITVTHPLAQCHFMTIPEAAQLVLKAGSLPESRGAITMLEMGEPVRILDLAKKLIRFSGRVPGKDVSIVFTGLRPGEKLTQAQSSSSETAVATPHPKILITQTAESSGPDLIQGLSRLFAYLDGGDRAGLLRTLCELVPECVEPLAQHRSISDARLDPHCSVRDSSAWQALLNTNQSSWRERRTPAVRPVPPADRHIGERREGVECRRKEARAGGRRRTDVGVLSPARSTSQQGVDGEPAISTADRFSNGFRGAVS